MTAIGLIKIGQAVIGAWIWLNEVCPMIVVSVLPRQVLYSSIHPVMSV